MHEMSLACSMVTELERLCREHQAQTVQSVFVRLGVWSGVDRATLEFAFPFAAENTLAAGAALVVEEVPVRVRCGDCTCISEPAAVSMGCGKCGSSNVELVAGRELVIASVQLRQD